MIVCDLDGTLLNKRGYISEYTALIIERARKQKILFCIATARYKDNLSEIREILCPNFIISCDGALIESENKIIYNETINISLVDYLLSFVKKNRNKMNIETINNCYRNYWEPPSGFYDFNFFDSHFTDFDNEQITDVLRLGLEIEREQKDNLFSIANNDCRIEFIYDWYCQIKPKNADKFVALQYLSNLFNIELDKIVTFGNSYNDIDIISNCGIGVAVENSLEEIKQYADYICESNNNNGVAHWIEENLLE